MEDAEILIRYITAEAMKAVHPEEIAKALAGHGAILTYTEEGRVVMRYVEPWERS